MLSFFRKNTAETALRDPDEMLWHFQSQPDVFINRYLRKSDPMRREYILELTEPYSLSFTSGVIAITRGNISRKNEIAVKDALYRTEYSREFVDFAVSLGILDKSLESLSERVVQNDGKLKFLFAFRPSDNTLESSSSLGYVFSRSVSDIENISEAMSSICSFDNVSRQLNQFTQTFRDHNSSFVAKVQSAASFYLLIHADQEIRGSIRKEDVSSWIDIYDPTEIDRELIESWLGYCDPLMKAGYYSLLVDAQSDLSERSDRANTVLDILEGTHKDVKTTSLGLGGQVVNELEDVGIYCKISPEVLQNSIARRCPETTQKFTSYSDSQIYTRERVGTVVDILFEQSSITLYPSASSEPLTPGTQEKKLIHRLAKLCLGERGHNHQDSALSRKTLLNALKISKDTIRHAALNLLVDPTNDRFESFISQVESPFSEIIITSLLNSELHDQAFRWLEKNPSKARPHLERRLFEQGFENQLVAISLLSLIAKSNEPDSKLANLLARQFAKEKRPVIQTHLLRALGSVQDRDSRHVSLFRNSLNQGHLQAEAINALAKSGQKGLRILEDMLNREKAQIINNIHERKTPLLSNNQKIIVSALPAAGPEGGKVLRRFLERYNNCYTTHLVTDFLRSVKEPHFGMNDTKVLELFGKYCDKEDQ